MFYHDSVWQVLLLCCLMDEREDANGNRGRQSAGVFTVVADTASPKLSVKAFSPFLVNAGKPLEISYAVDEKCTVALNVVDKTGTKVIRYLGMQQVKAGAYYTLWDGMESSGFPVSSETYIIQADAVDLAGNESTAAVYVDVKQ